MSAIRNLNYEYNPFPDYDKTEQRFQDYLHTVSAKVRNAIENVGLEYKEIFSNQGNQNQDQLDRLFQCVDLTVFPDDHVGHLPINGIKREDYEKIKYLFNLIITNQSSIEVEQGSSREFRENALLDLLILLSRPNSRSLIIKLAQQPQSIIISSGDETKYHVFDKRVKLRSEPTLTVIAESPDGKRFLSELPRWIQLGHELTHALHHCELPEDTLHSGFSEPTLGKEYHCLAEQYTILGNAGSKYPFLQENERNYCLDFSIPYRDNHLSTRFSSEVPLDQNSNKGTALMHAVEKGAILNVVAWFQNGGKLSDIKDGDLLLHKAIEHGRQEIALLLIENNAPLNKTDSSGKQPLELAKSHNQEEIAQRISERLDLKDEF